jgi:hypothetical protein
LEIILTEAPATVARHRVHTDRPSATTVAAARVAAPAARDTRRMLTREDIEEIAGALPETTVEHSPDGRLSFRVRNRWFLAHREPRPDAVDAETGERLEDVIMIRVADEGVKQALAADPSGPWFTTTHFNGYPAILVRLRDLDKVSRDELEEVIVEGWLCQAPKRLAEAWLTERDEPT